MRRVNKPFNLAKGVQAAVDLRADVSSFQMKILRDGEMAWWLRMGLTIQENPRLIPSTHAGELTTVYKFSFRGFDTLFWPPRVLYLCVPPNTHII